jgi:Tol biopolymer transport system component
MDFAVPNIFFSPDGNHLAYDLPESRTSHLCDLFVFDIIAGREIPMAARRGLDIMLGWSPDGKLLFGSDRSGSVGLWAQALQNGTPRGAPELLKPDLGSVVPLGVTQSGTLYYGVVTGSSLPRVHIGSIDFSSGRITSTRDVSEDYLEGNSLPMWSPDGRQFAYLSRRGSAYRGVTVIAIRSTETGQLVRELPANGNTTLDGWAPDGQSLVGVGHHNGRRGALRIDVQTGAVTPLFVDPPDQLGIRNAVWSPDGKGIYYLRRLNRGAEFAIIRRDVGSDAEAELIRRPLLGFPNLSPDGRLLATPSVDSASNTRNLLLIPTDGGEPMEVIRVPSEVRPADLKTNKGVRPMAPMWTPDSKSILFRKRRAADTTDEQWIFSLDGGSPRKLEAPVETNQWLYRVHPDGERILFTAGGDASPRQTQIWTLENFLPASK